MIEVFGPTYRYQGERLTAPEIVVVNDHHYDDQDHCYHVAQLLANSDCDPSQHILVMDHVNHEDELKTYHCLCLPIFIAESCEEFKQQNITFDWANKTHAFNFMINKPRPHREFLMMLIEHFDLTNYTHTLPWQSINLNKQSFKQITDNAQYQRIIDQSNVSIPMTNYHFGSETTLEHGILNGSYKNSETYQYLLQKTVFEPACISLITEPAFYERETIHTEKTVMAIYGGTFPIWVGGWGLADWMTSLGFDVFDDIIDHSYQYMTDPMDRCYHAVKLNLELLQNFDLAHSLIQKNQSRLEHNLTLLKQNVFLTDCIDKVKKYPDHIQSVLYSVIPKYRGNTAGSYRSLPSYRLLGSTNTRKNA